MMAKESERWRAVLDRDAAADGSFVYAVVTTGIYCRPSCPTPTPLHRNARFFENNTAAEAAGFCACKRCRPDQVSPRAWQVDAVGKACAIMHAREHAPSLAALAAAVGVSRFHFHRIFKQVLGVTPDEYAKTVRWRRLADSLEAGRPVAEAIFAAGYGSLSRAYEKAGHALGMTPAARGAGGSGSLIRFALADRQPGHVLVACTKEGVCAIELGDDPSDLEERLHRHLPAAMTERWPADGAAWIVDMVDRAALPPRALELAPEIREAAFSARLRREISERWAAGLPTSGMAPVWPVRDSDGVGADSGRSGDHAAKGREAGAVFHRPDMAPARPTDDAR